ncbi:hypothetical protein GMDG_07663 [Pseudogymnoascus destructans 20631-21]|uniref:Uncharacterized protein n=1 Tax=Pseudogymnoascus destructans (strain ATCC MYA-4855 / 20631-21) TaxID=658429 RepID=L8FY06_PSED2|nr:hypothetical protein GMDG_07663 [Pseudogymnoascus destructans 20631-21]
MAAPNTTQSRHLERPISAESSILRGSRHTWRLYPGPETSHQLTKYEGASTVVRWCPRCSKTMESSSLIRFGTAAPTARRPGRPWGYWVPSSTGILGGLGEGWQARIHSPGDVSCYRTRVERPRGLLGPS